MKKPTKRKAPQQRAALKTPGSTDQLLTGWPAIAKYLGQPQAVAQRWAKDGMPVEKKGRSMTAKPEELSKWLSTESGAKAPVHISQAADQDLLSNLRKGLAQARSDKRMSR